MVKTCSFCGKGYKTQRSLWNHEQRFHALAKVSKKLKEKAAELKKKEQSIAALKSTYPQPAIVNNTTINNTINNNITINIKFGDEDIEKLSRAEIYKVLNSGYTALQTLIQLVHKNPRLPEFNNIKMTVPKNPLCRVHNGEKYVQQTKSSFFDQLLELRADDLSELHEKYGDATKLRHRRIREVVSNVMSCLENERNIDSYDKGMSKHYKTICEEITALLCD
jgi:hypothetical protein